MRNHIFSRFISLCMTFVVLIGLTACGSAKQELPKVNISLWADERKTSLISDAMADFARLYEDEAEITFTVSEEGEDTCRETVLSNIQGAADIYAFASDQIDSLIAAGALLDISTYLGTEKTNFLDKFGVSDSGVVGTVVRGDKVYATPETASNGYFLYYNKKYLTENDVLTLDGILNAVNSAGKKFTMDYSSGWYIYSFFKGAGLELEATEDQKSNICNWNSTDGPYTGVMVTESMLNLANNPGFVNLGDDGFVEGVESGEVVAGINGAWNADKIKKAWGDDMAATKLPTYTIGDGEQLQMCSFTGYKLLGINAYTENPEWCTKFVDFYTSPEYQIREFEAIGEAPANTEAAESEEVLASPAIAALAEQSQFGYVQNVADQFWDASNKFGVTIAAGNPDNRSLQSLLDKLVTQTTKSA